jgi:hypothetical protein
MGIGDRYTPEIDISNGTNLKVAHPITIDDDTIGFIPGSADNDMLQWNESTGLWETTQNPSAPADGIFGHWTRDDLNDTLAPAVLGDTLRIDAIGPEGGTDDDLIQLGFGQVDVNGDLVVQTQFESLSTGTKIQQDAGGDIVCFGDTDVDNAVDGKKLTVWRMAAEGDNWISIFADKDRLNTIQASSALYYRSTFHHMLLGSATRSHYMSVRTDGSATVHRFYADGSAAIQKSLGIGRATSVEPIYALEVNGVTKTESGRIVKTTRLTANTTLDTTHHEVFCDTDGGAFTVTLPATPVGQTYRITNTGSNTLTLGRNGNTIKGSATDAIIPSGDTLILTWEPTEGWW